MTNANYSKPTQREIDRAETDLLITLSQLTGRKFAELSGWHESKVMVPESVTPAMAVAGGDMFVKSEQVSEYPTDAARNIYRAMLAAAPQEVK